MGEIQFRFIGPAAYGDRVTLKLELTEIRERTLHWHCTAKRTLTGEPVTEGTATRVYARINEDGTLKSAMIPDEMRRALTSAGVVTSFAPKGASK
jgi:acyl-CoA thioesterase FadM